MPDLAFDPGCPDCDHHDLHVYFDQLRTAIMQHCLTPAGPLIYCQFCYASSRSYDRPELLPHTDDCIVKRILRDALVLNLSDQKETE